MSVGYDIACDAGGSFVDVVALVAMRGFANVPDLGRQSRRDSDALDPPPPTPAWLSPRGRRIEAARRIGPAGEEVEPFGGTADGPARRFLVAPAPAAAG